MKNEPDNPEERERALRKAVTRRNIVVGVLLIAAVPAGELVRVLIHDGIREHGTTADSTHFPWHVWVYGRNSSGSVHIECGGSLINDGWIVTAAHCFPASPEATVRVGSHDKFGGTEFKLEKSSIFIHPSFDPIHEVGMPYKSDIALLQLPKLPSSPAAAVKLPESATTTITPAFVAGWACGPPEPYSFLWRDVTLQTCEVNALRYAQVATMTEVDCKNAYPGDDTNPVQNVLCAGGVKAGFDHTDSGGGLSTEKEEGATLIGVVSTLRSKDSQGNYKPDVYTDVYSYKLWIKACQKRIDSECCKKGEACT